MIKPIIIIFGSQDREKEHSSGEFHCPNCGRIRPYTHKRVTRDFTLYFLPIFETKELAEYIECDVCQGKFTMDVLNIKPPPSREKYEENIQDRIKRELRSGTPVQDVHKGLVNSGKDKRGAAKLLNRILGDMIKICPICQLTYHRSISNCSDCGSELRFLPR